MMQAIVLREHGGPEVLVAERIPVPEPGPREVRVRIRAVSLNHLDLWVRRGGPAFHLEYPHRLGSDIAGVVDAVGPGVVATPGDKVVVQPGLSCGLCRACLDGHIAAGRLEPIVHRVLPLAEAAAEHRILEERQAFGKVVLEPPGAA